MKNPPQFSPVSKKISVPSARELAAKFGIKPLSAEARRKNLFIARLRYALLVLFYLGAGGLCLSEPVQRPWGAPTPEAKWTEIVKRDDPRPFLIRLLLSIRYDFYHRDIRGGADF